MQPQTDAAQRISYVRNNVVSPAMALGLYV